MNVVLKWLEGEKFQYKSLLSLSKIVTEYVGKALRDMIWYNLFCCFKMWNMYLDAAMLSILVGMHLSTHSFPPGAHHGGSFTVGLQAVFSGKQSSTPNWKTSQQNYIINMIKLLPPKPFFRDA